MISFIQVVISAAIFGLALGQTCPCALVDSTRYPGTMKWDCMSLGLVAVPGQCWDVENNVTEVELSLNNIGQVQNIDFAGLTKIKALYVDNNALTFFDVSAVSGATLLEIFHGENNPLMSFPSNTLRFKPNLQEVVLVSNSINDLGPPLMTDTTALNRYDLRSSGLISVPRPLFNSALTSPTFLLNFFGNFINEMAADVLIPLPDGATINLDSFTTLWATDEFQYYEILGKNFNINIDLTVNMRVCQQDGTPVDPSMCA